MSRSSRIPPFHPLSSRSNSNSPSVNPLPAANTPNRTTAVQQHTPDGSPAPSVTEFVCLYTHDIAKKRKVWQDGFANFHSFNKRILVFDTDRHLISDTHWRGVSAPEEGETIRFEDHGVLAELGSVRSRIKSDVTPLVQRRALRQSYPGATKRRLSEVDTPSPHGSADPKKKLKPFRSVHHLHVPLTSILNPRKPARDEGADHMASLRNQRTAFPGQTAALPDFAPARAEPSSPNMPSSSLTMDKSSQVSITTTEERPSLLPAPSPASPTAPLRPKRAKIKLSGAKSNKPKLLSLESTPRPSTSPRRPSGPSPSTAEASKPKPTSTATHFPSFDGLDWDDGDIPAEIFDQDLLPD